VLALGGRRIIDLALDSIRPGFMSSPLGCTLRENQCDEDEAPFEVAMEEGGEGTAEAASRPAERRLGFLGAQLIKRFAGDAYSGVGYRPPTVEGEVCDGLNDLVLGDAVL
jgi:hypothetical protein